jgi:hypothetical protein
VGSYFGVVVAGSLLLPKLGIAAVATNQIQNRDAFLPHLFLSPYFQISNQVEPKGQNTLLKSKDSIDALD